MVLLLNPRAAGGTALNKWRCIEKRFALRFPGCTTHILDGSDATSGIIRRARRLGETDFVAAGGDGTVNAVLGALLSERQSPEGTCVRLGAVGLGSSNDFHKPFVREQFIDGIPLRVDFQRAVPYDVGCLSFEHNGPVVNRYFLSNASCGVTAEANWFFNHPDSILGFLKRHSPPAAILYAATRTIFRYRSFRARCSVSPDHSVSVDLTNLAVLKNPHVSGSFTYDTPVGSDDGMFAMALCERMSRAEVLHLLYSLAHGKFSRLPHTRSWYGASLTVSAGHPFAVEYDGEVIATSAVEFSLLPKLLEVCP